MPEIDDRNMAWLRLSLVPRLGPVSGARLLKAFGGPEEVFIASRKDLLAVEGVGKALADSIRNPSYKDRAARDADQCSRKGIDIVALDDPAYPPLLREISDPPLILYMKGSLPEGGEDSVAMVGARNPDPYGESMAASIAAGLARYGLCVVSGMARGIDGAAQKAALKAGGRSVAVLGTGVDVVYPAEHKSLYEALSERGAVMSEFPLGVGPEPGNFPRRNRIVSGMSQGVVMVQALSKKSGALITVRMALEQNREVFAVPGNAGSRGGRMGNSLIKDGAKLVETAEDVVVHLKPIGAVGIESTGPEEREGVRKISLPDDQARVYALVPVPSEGEIDIDALARQAGMNPGEASSALLDLELSGLVKSLPGRRYVRLTES